MTPYRNGTLESGNSSILFGDSRKSKMRWVLGFGGIALSALIAAIWVSGIFGVAGINGSILLPAVLGIVLLLSEEWGSIEFLRGTRELCVTHKRFFRRTRKTFPVSDLIGVDVGLLSTKKDALYELQLILCGGRTVRLMRAGRVEDLEPWRLVVSQFVLDNHILTPPEPVFLAPNAIESNPREDMPEPESQEAHARRTR